MLPFRLSLKSYGVYACGHRVPLLSLYDSTDDVDAMTEEKCNSVSEAFAFVEIEDRRHGVVRTITVGGDSLTAAQCGLTVRKAV